MSISELASRASIRSTPPGVAFRLLWGSLLLFGSVAVAPRAGRAGAREIAVLRLLGARHILQALLLGRWHGRRALRLSALADGVHALSMTLLALLRPRLKKPALASAAVSLTFCATAMGPRGRVRSHRLSGS